MALVGLFDRTYRERYDNLMLYEYILGNSDTIPPRFEDKKFLYEFIQ
ncbi:hypothetical protein KBC03_05520 [Patescibacteria group bacterium]|nr:hypothetical protein [Patescibacteria group bacterium]